MFSQLAALQKFWIASSVPTAAQATLEEVNTFESSTKLLLPEDVRYYFAQLNGTANNYDDHFFRFNSLTDFKSIHEELRYWGGVPDYTNIVNTLPESEHCFVFADYSIQLMTYAIRLHLLSQLMMFMQFVEMSTV